MTAISVAPKDTPNVTGLRHETGPYQGPPSTAKTPRCTRPESISSRPTPRTTRSTDDIPDHHAAEADDLASSAPAAAP